MKKIILILIAVYLVIPAYSQKNNITQKKENVENLNFPSAIINDDNVRLRTEPNLYCDKICLLAKNTQVEIIKISKIFLNIDGKNFPWIKVRVIKDSKAVSGWVYGQYVDVSYEEIEKFVNEAHIKNYKLYEEFPEEILPGNIKKDKNFKIDEVSFNAFKDKIKLPLQKEKSPFLFNYNFDYCYAPKEKTMLYAKNDENGSFIPADYAPFLNYLKILSSDCGTSKIDGQKLYKVELSYNREDTYERYVKKSDVVLNAQPAYTVCSTQVYEDKQKKNPKIVLDELTKILVLRPENNNAPVVKIMYGNDDENFTKTGFINTDDFCFYAVKHMHLYNLHKKAAEMNDYNYQSYRMNNFYEVSQYEMISIRRKDNGYTEANNSAKKKWFFTDKSFLENAKLLAKECPPEDFVYYILNNDYYQVIEANDEFVPSISLYKIPKGTVLARNKNLKNKGGSINETYWFYNPVSKKAEITYIEYYLISQRFSFDEIVNLYETANQLCDSSISVKQKYSELFDRKLSEEMKNDLVQYVKSLGLYDYRNEAYPLVTPFKNQTVKSKEMQKTVNVYQGPSVIEPVIGTFNDGAKVTATKVAIYSVVGEYDYWYCCAMVYVSDGKSEGWIDASNLVYEWSPEKSIIVTNDEDREIYVQNGRNFWGEIENTDGYYKSELSSEYGVTVMMKSFCDENSRFVKDLSFIYLSNNFMKDVPLYKDAECTVLTGETLPSGTIVQTKRILLNLLSFNKEYICRLNYYIQTEDKCGWIPDEFAYSGVDWSYKDTMFNYRNWDTRFPGISNQ